MLNPKRHTIQVAGQTWILETDRIARQANGAVLLTCGDTVVFASACCSAAANPGDFLPLRVDYIEKFSSAGKTLGGFIKREGKSTERETLVSRLIDRPIRPMFPDGFFDEVQTIAYVWSYDEKYTPDVLAINATSAALTISDIPLLKPIGAARVGLVNDTFVVNPGLEEMKASKLDLVLAGTTEAILMIEGRCDFLTEEQLLEALKLGHNAIKQFCEALATWQSEVGKAKNTKRVRPLDAEVLQSMNALFGEKTRKALLTQGKKEDRVAALDEVTAELMAHFVKEDASATYKIDIQRAYYELRSQLMRKHVLETGIRLDGRQTTEIRPIAIETGILPRTHGSCLFTRGETQSVAVCTLGSESMGQRYEDLNEDSTRRFYLQYSFPPFSVGEVGRMGPPGRREVGHGKLAERALEAISPSKEQFTYTIRLESNITESNGSSSMASVCGGCLAMMDAGVPIKRPVAGIAMGLILDKDRFCILSDILGAEDALGDMDFKVTGDHDGITAFQMDIKVEGITLEIMAAALKQAKSGRIHILEQMLKACPSSRPSLSQYAPRILSLKIKPSQIGTVIGPGGKQIRNIIETCGPNVTVDIDDTGLVSICGTNAKGVEAAEKMVRQLTAEVEVGKIYEGKVTEVLAFGVIVEVISGKEGLCHISEMDHQRIQSPGDLAKVGDKFTVKVLEMDERGKIRLSRKATLPKPVKAAE